VAGVIPGSATETYLLRNARKLAVSTLAVAPVEELEVVARVSREAGWEGELLCSAGEELVVVVWLGEGGELDSVLMYYTSKQVSIRKRPYTIIMSNYTWCVPYRQ
jgi:hypothetical protein